MRCLINSVSEIEGWGREIGTFVNFQLVSIFLFFYGSKYNFEYFSFINIKITFWGKVTPISIL